ncbi:MAG: PhzF family phenazine biosynthesis protein [Desulfobacterales bacterium]|nr:PhzF family phenazine biosynthesis protein [Desulfobacterales bacterium]
MLPHAEGLSEDEMQKIARETNLSETAFVFPSDKAAARVRYFMPHKEIPFAGHPTIASAFMLALEEMIPRGEDVQRVDFEFNIGVLPVEIHRDAGGKPVYAVMSQQAPSYGPRADSREAAPCLGLDKDDFIEAAPIQVVGAGVPFLMAPVRSLEEVRRARMDRPKLASLLEAFEVDAAYLYCPGGVESNADLHGRLFSPANATEDPFTGSAVGGAGAHMAHHGLHPGPRLNVEQGHIMGRPGKGVVEVSGAAGHIETVKVGGAAVKVLDGFLEFGSREAVFKNK